MMRPLRVALAAAAAAAARRPDVVIILADDVGVGDVAGMPAVSALAARGVNFTDAHSQPLCSPSRYALLSGRPPSDGRANGGWGPPLPSLFLPGQRSIGRAFADLGYRTGFFGKWGVGGKAAGVPTGSHRYLGTWVLSAAAAPSGHRLEDGPSALGFETSLMLPAGIQGPPFAWFVDDALAEGYDEARDGVKWIDPTNPKCGYTAPSRAHVYEDGGVSVTGIFDGRLIVGEACRKGLLFRNGTYFSNETDGTRDYRSDTADVVLWRRARRFVQDGRDDDRPFFLLLSTAAAHTPFTPPRKLAGRAIPRSGSPFADMLAGLDALVAGVVRTLTEENKLDDTILVFTSDNGGQMHGKDLFAAWEADSWPIHGPPAWKVRKHGPLNVNGNGPLRGHKGQVYEGGHRVSMVASWPAALPAGATFPGLVSHTDLYHTLLSFAGGGAGDAPATSVDHSRALRSPPAAWSADAGRRRLAVQTSTPMWQDHKWRVGLRDGALKLIVATPDRRCLSQRPLCAETSVEALYDLGKDLGETTNLLDDMPACEAAVGAPCDRRTVFRGGFRGEAIVAHFLGLDDAPLASETPTMTSDPQ